MNHPSFMIADEVIQFGSEIFGGLVDFMQKTFQDPYNLLVLVIIGFIAVWVLAEYSASGRLQTEL